MSKTLIVHYLPRGERSKTRELVEHFRAAVGGKTEVEELDLIADTPNMLLGDNLMAYVLRNMAGQEISPEQNALLEKMDRHCAQLMTADNVVLAFPMYNFSMPAVVKAWVDEVVQAGKTFTMENGQYKTLMNGKNALVINTRGGVYAGDWAGMEHAVSLGASDFSFMGFEVETAVAEGANMLSAEEFAASMNAAKEQIDDAVGKWYA